MSAIKAEVAFHKGCHYTWMAQLHQDHNDPNLPTTATHFTSSISPTQQRWILRSNLRVRKLLVNEKQMIWQVNRQSHGKTSGTWLFLNSYD